MKVPRTLMLSSLTLVLSLMVFLMSAVAWFTISNQNTADNADIGITESADNEYVFEINSGEIENSDLYILPGEVKRYELTTENLENAILSLTITKEVNECYITATDKTKNYANILLNQYHTSNYVNIFYDINGNLINSEYNLYKGLYLDNNEKVTLITNGVNTINLFYKDDINIYNTNDYYLYDSLYTLNNKSSIFNNMIEANDIRNAIKYCYRKASDGENPVINWVDESYILNATAYTITDETTYIYVYFDPTVYASYNNIVLRNSNVFMFQAINISFVARAI